MSSETKKWQPVVEHCTGGIGLHLGHIDDMRKVEEIKDVYNFICYGSILHGKFCSCHAWCDFCSRELHICSLNNVEVLMEGYCDACKSPETVGRILTVCYECMVIMREIVDDKQFPMYKEPAE